MENEDHVKRIARKLTEIADGEWYICHQCGETIHESELGDVVGNETHECPKCDSDDFTTMDLLDYLDTVYDIEYRVESKHADSIKSVELCVAFGGPNIYIDTKDCKVKLYWWMEYAEAEFPQHVGDLIRDCFEDVWRCS